MFGLKFMLNVEKYAIHWVFWKDTLPINKQFFFVWFHGKLAVFLKTRSFPFGALRPIFWGVNSLLVSQFGYSFVPSKWVKCEIPIPKRVQKLTATCCGSTHCGSTSQKKYWGVTLVVYGSNTMFLLIPRASCSGSIMFHVQVWERVNKVLKSDYGKHELKLKLCGS